MSFDYGQRHRVELNLAKEQAVLQNVVEHITVNIDLRQFGGSALTADIDVPKDRDEATMDADIPITYVPARNTVFLSYALAWAEVLGSNDIYIGVNALDYSGYPDCRPEFISAFEHMASLATKRGVTGQRLSIHTPLISLTKAQIIALGLEMGVKYESTSSCYDRWATVSSLRLLYFAGKGVWGVRACRPSRTQIWWIEGLVGACCSRARVCLEAELE